MRNDPKDPEAWFDYAQEDLLRAEKRLAEPDIIDALFHMQQCAEKALKGRLIALGWDLERTHNLAKLLQELAAKGIKHDWFNDSADILTTQYLVDRYPHVSEPLPEPATLQTLMEETRNLFRELSGRPAAK